MDPRKQLSGNVTFKCMSFIKSEQCACMAALLSTVS